TGPVMAAPARRRRARPTFVNQSLIGKRTLNVPRIPPRRNERMTRASPRRRCGVSSAGGVAGSVAHQPRGERRRRPCTEDDGGETGLGSRRSGAARRRRLAPGAQDGGPHGGGGAGSL